VWYYIYLKTKSIAILRPKVNNYKVVEVHFDKHDKLSSVILYTNDKIKKLNFKQWESPLRGSKEDLLQDFLYNMGRFNKAAPVKK
jgi:outer membrane protein assembly factor BamE (lipoprotein component of BamABCDE complex)